MQNVTGLLNCFRFTDSFRLSLSLFFDRDLDYDRIEWKNALVFFFTGFLQRKNYFYLTNELSLAFFFNIDRRLVCVGLYLFIFFFINTHLELIIRLSAVYALRKDPD